MGYICTRCGGTNVTCEAIVNPNTGKIIDYFDGSFMHAICAGCENEVIISNVEGVKHEIEAEKKIMLCVFDYGLSTDNVIYYSHTNTLSFNWNGYGEKITQEEFDDFVNKVDRSQLPEGIKFELK